jgi:hypothetical protein
MDFYKYFDWDFSSQHFLFTFLLQNGQKVWEIQIFVLKMQKKFQKSWQKSRNLEKSQQISKILISLENLNKNLDPAKSRFKRLNLKILTDTKKKLCLNSKDNLDTFQKLILTVEPPGLAKTRKIVFFKIQKRWIGIKQYLY